MNFFKKTGVGAALAVALMIPAFGATAAQAVQTIPAGYDEFTLSSTEVEAGGSITASLGERQWTCIDGDGPGEVLLEVGDTVTAATVGAYGLWEAVLTAPTQPGTYQVTATCASYGTVFSYNPVTISVLPGENTNPSGDVCNASTKARGEGWYGIIPENELDSTNSGNFAASILGNTQLKVVFGPSCVGQQFLFGNERLNLGSFEPDSHPGLTEPSTDGTGTITLPNDAAQGTYKISLQALNGHLFGWVAVTTDGNNNWSLSGSLPSTGGDDAADAPAAPSETSLTEANRGGVSIATISGKNVQLFVGTKYAGDVVFGTVFSTPQSLGSATVNASGHVTFALPAGLEAGAHRIALQQADGTLIGWASIELAADGTWTAPELAATGGVAMLPLGIAGIALLGAGALLIAGRKVSGVVRANIK